MVQLIVEITMIYDAQNLKLKLKTYLFTMAFNVQS